MAEKRKYHYYPLLNLISFLYCISVSAQGQLNTTWHMKPVSIQTRWAKDVSPDYPLKEYPRPQMERSTYWKNLNGLWQYTVTGKDATRPSNYEGKILVPFPIESALSGVARSLLPNEILWYKTTFSTPANLGSNKLLIHFGAIDWKATIYLNGAEVGTHVGGYTKFSYDVTNFLKDGNNELIVKVYDPTDKGIGPHGKQVLNPGNIYYTPSSGIWQTVWVEEVPNTYISELKFTPDIDKGVLNIRVTASGQADIQLTVKEANTTVSELTGKSGYLLQLPVPNAKLWTPDSPFLYNLKVKLLMDGKLVDSIDSYFGMRKINIQKDGNGIERIFLNNKYTYNLGILDQGFWPDGLYTAPSDEALKFDIMASKAMGFNTIRKHIKIEPERWYYHADKLGVLVWQDFVNPNQSLPEGAKEAFEKQVAETIDQLQNFPCIVTWVIFNEKWGQYDQKRLTEWVKERDPSRIINGHSGELLYVNDVLRSPSPNAYISADLVDIHSYPFPRNFPSLPGKAKVIGEFGGIGVPIIGHLWDDLVPGWGYDGIVSPEILKTQYGKMIDSLKKLQDMGVTASIYTQPFDVESEQNGLITYDRQIIKLPIDTFRVINSRIWPVTSNFEMATADFDSGITSLSDNGYSELILKYKKGAKDSVTLRNLTILSASKKDWETCRKSANDYIKTIKDPFNISNLRFILKFTRNSSDDGFAIIKKQSNKINAILGMNTAEIAIRTIVKREDILPHMNIDSVPNWKRISAVVSKKYGLLGTEALSGIQMLYYWNNKDWEKFGIYYAQYYKTATARSEYHINNMSWEVFEHITDTSILNIAVKASKFSLDNFSANDPNEMDTYANLLYKTGNMKEALKFQEMAVNISGRKKDFVERLEKMQKNIKTWD